jgi:two-component system, OmpR family, sensor kinase
MAKRLWINLLLISLPFWVGLICGILSHSFLEPETPVLVQTDLGLAAFVFGGVVRQWSFFGFLLGFLITALLVLFYYWDLRSIRHAKGIISDATLDLEQNRRNFLRRLDHEIKNPLTGMRAALVNLQEAQSKDERIRAAENASRAVTRLTRLLSDLRKLSDLGERPIEQSNVDVPDLLQDVVDAAHVLPVYDGREVSLLIPKVPSPFPCLVGDRDLLVLAIYNLIENALKFTGAEDSVEVRVSEDGQVIVIEVADSGVGIPVEDVPKIFEELYRGSNARSTEGSGLGLALVRRIVDLHNGQIHVRSSQIEPRGTVFTIRLPVSKRG